MTYEISRSQMSSENGPSAERKAPVRLTRAQLKIIQGVGPGDPAKWKNTPVLEVNGIRVDSGIQEIDLEGRLCRIYTDRNRFGQVVA